jgi:hypothetical protein
LRYAYINKKIPSNFTLQKGAQIQGLLKYDKYKLHDVIYRNYQPYGIFISLNLGVSGFVQTTKSVQFLKSNHKIGDILTFTVEDFYDS